MKRIAKITVALLLAVAMCFSLAGCYDEDLNWSAKYDDTELPAGAYIYYLSIAYNEAASKVLSCSFGSYGKSSPIFSLYSALN